MTIGERSDAIDLAKAYVTIESTGSCHRLTNNETVLLARAFLLECSSRDKLAHASSVMKEALIEYEEYPNTSQSVAVVALARFEEIMKWD